MVLEAFTPLSFYPILEDTARYAGLLLAPVERFGLRPRQKRELIMQFLVSSRKGRCPKKVSFFWTLSKSGLFKAQNTQYLGKKSLKTFGTLSTLPPPPIKCPKVSQNRGGKTIPQNFWIPVEQIHVSNIGLDTSIYGLRPYCSQYPPPTWILKRGGLESSV